MNESKCPNCGGELHVVTRPSDSCLSPDQFDAVRAGDFYCMKCPSNDRGNTGYRYFWEHELMDARDAQIAALRAELERKDAALWRAGLALHHCEGELSAIGSRGTVDANNVKNFSAEARAAIRWVEEALQPKEPPCQTA